MPILRGSSSMRKPRVLRDGALYHVTARANRKEMVLDNKGMKDLFLDVVARARKKYRFCIENFCVMGNHFHLMIRPGPGESLSRIMQWIMSVFAMKYNRTWELTGHVWGERFFSRIIESFGEYLMIFDYIDSNPVESRRVSYTWDWPHGGLRHHQNGWHRVVDRPAGYLSLSFPAHALLCLPSGA